MSAPNCRGCWELGNNCGTCPRCVATAPKVDAAPSPAVLAPVDVAAVLATLRQVAGELDWMAGAHMNEAASAVEQLAADLAAAREEVARLTAESVRRTMLHACDLNALRQRAEAAEADAARYLHLRNSDNAALVVLGPVDRILDGADLDAAIDAALQEPRP